MGKKINELNILINKAIVTSISVTIQENGEVLWEVSGKLISNNGVEVSNFRYYSKSWDDKLKLKIPIEADMHGEALFKIFQQPIIEKINGVFKQLPKGENK
jgi:hypothetical protein